MKMKSEFMNIWVRIWLIILVMLIGGAIYSVNRLIQLLPKESFEQKLRASIARETSWIVKNQKESGDFVYERLTATGEVNDGNSIVRQAGAMYGLGQAYRYKKDPQVAQAFEKGLTYFKDLTATKSATLAAVSHEGSTFTNTTALLVLGLTEYIEADDRNNTVENLEYLVRLSNYLESTQATTGAYINSYSPVPSESDYNNGETMYALIRSYQITQKDSYLASVKRMADYAITHYGADKFHSSFFSWGMAGFAYLYTIEPNEKYWKHLSESFDTYMKDRGVWYEKYIQSKEGEPVTPGSAVFLEGVNHIGWIAKAKNEKLYKKINQHLRRVLGHLLIYELNSPYGKYWSESASVSGAVCSQVFCESTRMDFTQHHLSAMTLYLKFFSEKR